MNIPDSFPKQFKLLIAVDMQKLMDASTTEWGKILRFELQKAEQIAVEQIYDFRSRMRVYRYCKSDPGEGFQVDYRIVLATSEDGTIHLLKPDLLPISDRALEANVGLLDGTYEEVEENGETFIREAKKKD